MDRRFALSGLAIVSSALVASAALGQSSASTVMGDAEKQHIADTAKVGTLSLAASRVAVTKAAHARVKEFAELEAAEQETVSDVLAMLQAPDQASGQIKVPSDDEVLSKLGPDDKAALDKLKGLSGKAFDAAYIKAEVDGHNKLLGIQQTYLSVGKNPENLAVAKLASGVIKEHLKHLASLPAAL